MREKILIDSLEEIKKKCIEQSERHGLPIEIHNISKKALSDYASAPKEASGCLRKINGCEECKELCKGCFEYFKMNEYYSSAPESGGEQRFLDSLRMVIVDACNNWREENERQTIPASAFLIIANAVAEKLQKEVPESGGEQKRAVELLLELFNLKSHKDTFGKDTMYLERQPKAWIKVKDFLDNYPTPPTKESGGEHELTINDYKGVLEDHKRLVRELDQMMNGEDAAPQASLCDLVAQIRNDATKFQERNITLAMYEQEIERLKGLIKDAYLQGFCDPVDKFDQFAKENGLTDK